MNQNNLSILSISVAFLVSIATAAFAQTKKTTAVQNITSTEIWIDRFNNASGKSILGTDWFLYTDKGNGGVSKVSPDNITNAYKNIVERNNDMAMQFSYSLDKGSYQWDPYVGLAVPLVDSNISVSLDNIKGIAYDYIGTRHTFMYALSSVKDFANFQRMVPASDEWKTMIIPISELHQPGWGKRVEFNPALIKALQWVIFGKTGDSGTLTIDNVRLLRKLPKEEQIITKEKAKTTTSKTRVVSDKVKIADWAGFKKSAYSLSFDDGLISHYKNVAPILDKYALNATFYIVTDRLEADTAKVPDWRYGYWYQFIALSKKNHELGSHSATHPKLTELPDGAKTEVGTLQYELSSPIKTIQQKIPGYKFVTFAYPFVDFNNHVIEETSTLYFSSRGFGAGFNSASSPQWMNLQAHSFEYSGNRTLKSDLEKVKALEKWITDNTIAKGGWTIFLAHDVLPFSEAINATDSYQPVSSESFDSLALWLSQKNRTQDLWLETVGNVTRYVKERDAVSIVLKEITNNKLLFQITDDLPDYIFNFPLTINVTLPENWKAVRTKQNTIENKLPVTDGKIQISVIPDSGDLEISKVE